MRIPSFLRRIVERCRSRFLRTARGVIHVGANTGQERDLYAYHGLDVLWIEPVPEAFAVLEQNLRGFKRQTAVQSLVTDVDDAAYDFHIANNGGQSSSLFDFGGHKEIWPTVAYKESIRVRGVTLPTLLKRKGIDPSRFDVLVMDVQGAELLVLRGAESLLPGWSAIKAEAADFDAYLGGARLADLDGFLRARGFDERRRHCFARRKGGGAYYEVLFTRTGPPGV